MEGADRLRLITNFSTTISPMSGMLTIMHSQMMYIVLIIGMTTMLTLGAIAMIDLVFIMLAAIQGSIMFMVSMIKMITLVLLSMRMFTTSVA